MDEVIQAFRREFQQLNVLEQWTTNLNNEIETFESEVKRFHRILIQLIALSVFSVPVIIITCLSYFIGFQNLNDVIHTICVIALCFGLMLSLGIGLPIYILTCWLAKEDYLRKHGCKCHHHCHKHFGYSGDSKHMFKFYSTIVRNFIISLLMSIIEFCGVRAYLCDLCKVSGKSTGCHCYHRYRERFLETNFNSSENEEMSANEDEDSTFPTSDTEDTFADNEESNNNSSPETE